MGSNPIPSAHRHGASLCSYMEHNYSNNEPLTAASTCSVLFNAAISAINSARDPISSTEALQSVAQKPSNQYRNRLTRLAASPVHQLADPALAARLLGTDVDALVDGVDAGPAVPRDGTLLGALFESLVTLSVRVYAQANEARVSHLRTRADEREIDLIVERADGRVVALEVKLSALTDEDDVRHLHWLAGRIGPNLLDAAVITTGREAYRRRDGIGVIPAALLTA